MAKGSKRVGHDNKSSRNKNADRSHDGIKTNNLNSGYLYGMSHAPDIGEPSNIFQMLPVIFFSSIIILITRMATYERPIRQFFYWNGDNQLNDFFSYYKMGAILVCAALALVFLLYRAFIQSFYIKRSYAYIPMIVYIAFVILSYVFSDYKIFALWGYNDRFEGTFVLISYMVLLFYVINTINTEKNVKVLVYSLAGVSTLLGLLGLTQATGHDFFQTVIGKKLITPSWFWDQIDSLNFTFDKNEIYQTVYNINYVSFYLTLLIPLFGLLFIRSVMLGKEEPLYKKLLWGALFALLLYNLIGSASSGGIMGMAIVVLIAIIILNKRILQWRKPVIILLIITLVVGGISYQRWTHELSAALEGVSGGQAEKIKDLKIEHKLDYIETKENDIVLGFNGDELVFKTYPDDPASITILDAKGEPVSAVSKSEDPIIFQIDDERYNWISIKPAHDDGGNGFIVLIIDDHEWPFLITKKGPKYYVGPNKFTDLQKVESFGFENNGSWGNGRGYVWSRSLPMLKDTLILGHGADTFCIYFPNNDYVGKYNSVSFTKKMNVIVDKPHNMYLGMSIGTGVISMLAMLILWGIYLVQSFLIYRRKEYNSFLSYAGVGIFLGICGFLAAGMVNDSSVSVMPMFYGLLGTGIAINMIMKKSQSR